MEELLEDAQIADAVYEANEAAFAERTVLKKARRALISDPKNLKCS